MPLGLDTALNLFWAAICVAGLCALAVLERRRFRHTTWQARRQRLAAVLLVSLALFPSVSYSDDLFSFSLLENHTSRGSGFGSAPPEDPGKETTSFQLSHVLHNLEHLELAGFFALILALWSVARAFSPNLTAVSRPVLCRSGRAPPLSL